MRVRFLSKGSCDQISGGYLYNKYLMAQLRAANVEVRYHGTPANLDTTADDVLIVDGLALGAGAEHLLKVPSKLVLLLHVEPDPQSLGDDGDELLAHLYRRARIVATGEQTLAAVRATGGNHIDATKIEPGVPQHWRAKKYYAERARALLAVANYLPGKGLARMLEVLHSLRELPWHLTVRGNQDFAPDHYLALQRQVREHGLDGRVELLGPVPHDAINEAMLHADLLLHFSQHESYSMATAEAIACGLPVLSYRTGNAAVFSRSGLVRYVDDDASEVEALRTLISDPRAYGALRRIGPPPMRTWRDVGRDFTDWLGAR